MQHHFDVELAKQYGMVEAVRALQAVNVAAGYVRPSRLPGC